MVTIKKYLMDYLYDHPKSHNHVLKLEKRCNTDKISLLSDTMFKAMFQNENRIKFSCKFLSYFLNASYEDLLKNLKLCKNEVNKTFENEKNERCDYVASIDGTTINIEINNNNSSAAMERNIEYTYKNYINKVKVGGDYNYTPVIQFNINNFAFKDISKTIDYFFIQNKDGTVLSKKICFVMIYVPKIREKWYNKGRDGLEEWERYILTLVEQDVNKSLSLSKGDEIMEEYVQEAINTSQNTYIGEAYDKEWALKDQSFRDGLDEGREQGIAQGIEQGIEQGIKQRNIEIAKKLLKTDSNIHFISEITGLTIKDINELKKGKQTIQLT